MDTTMTLLALLTECAANSARTAAAPVVLPGSTSVPVKAAEQLDDAALHRLAAHILSEALSAALRPRALGKLALQ